MGTQMDKSIGQWRAVMGPRYGAAWRIEDGDFCDGSGRLIANVYDNDHARLIASAPDLLEACREAARALRVAEELAPVDDRMPVIYGASKHVQAAIAKATEAGWEAIP